MFTLDEDYEVVETISYIGRPLQLSSDTQMMKFMTIVSELTALWTTTPLTTDEIEWGKISNLFTKDNSIILDCRISKMAELVTKTQLSNTL